LFLKSIQGSSFTHLVTTKPSSISDDVIETCKHIKNTSKGFEPSRAASKIARVE